MQDASSIQSETLNSSLADTTLTETATADVLTEEGERAEEMERAGLQPSLPFGIAQKRMYINIITGGLYAGLRYIWDIYDM